MPSRRAIPHRMPMSSRASPGGSRALRTRCTRRSELVTVPSLSHQPAEAGCGRGTIHHGWHRGGHGLHDVSTLQEAQERAESATEWMLGKLDATEGQQQRIQAIVDESVRNLYPLHEQHRLRRTQLLEAMSKPAVDRAEIESLRKAEIEAADAASDWLVDATLDVFEVLTPDQRSDMIDRIHERHL